MQIGANSVQGLDYAYTLQGWLKGMNADSLSSRNDMGRDGDTSNIHKWVARDVVGYAINYYNGDFTPIGTTLFDKDLANTSAYAAGSPGLFNGNIRAITVHTPILGDGKPIGYAYSYDQLHRLKAMDAWKGSGSNSLWQTSAAVTDYQERVTYDGNGNIQTYRRNATGSATMDRLRYVYNAQTNQLQFVTDSVPAAAFPNDIDNQGVNNYVYDGAGNMKTDASQGVTVAWGPYGKILSVGKTVSPASTLIYGYDPMQHRAMKAVIKGTDTLRTYYVRDAQGNVMGVYTRHNDSVSWREQYIYGSSRLGLYRADTLINKGLQNINKIYEGKRNYELVNHLGNVMAVINDRRSDSLIGTVKTYNAVVVSASDYYPFGLTIDSRSYAANVYRYGFNGKENDKEWGVQDYGMRIYEAGLGRFLSIDPIARKYPWYSSYQFAGNRPIITIDIDGLEDSIITNKNVSGYNVTIMGNKDNLTLSVAVFETKNRQVSVNADGSDAYHPNDEGRDYNYNGGIFENKKTGGVKGEMFGIYKNEDDKPVIQNNDQLFPGYFISTTFVTIQDHANSDPGRYLNSASIPYISVSQAFLNQTGAQWGDIGIVTNTVTKLTSFFIIGDKKSNMKTIELSLKLLENLGIAVAKKMKKSYDVKIDVEKINGVNTVANLDIIIYRGSGINPNKTKNTTGANKGISNEIDIIQMGVEYSKKLNDPKNVKH